GTPLINVGGRTAWGAGAVMGPPLMPASSQRPSGEIETGVVPGGSAAARKRTWAGAAAPRNVASVDGARTIATIDTTARDAHRIRSRVAPVTRAAPDTVRRSPLAIHCNSLSTSKADWIRCLGSFVRQRL